MDLGEAVIVAGLGFRSDATGNEIVAAVDAALARQRRARVQLSRLATSAKKSAAPGLMAAGRMLGLGIIGIDKPALQAVADQTLSRSGKSLEASGVPSLSEAAALAAAGAGARLLGPRLALGPVTCALAEVAT